MLQLGQGMAAGMVSEKLRLCLSAASFETFLKDNIKVGGKIKVLGEQVKVAREKSKITVTAETHMSKRCVSLCEVLESGGK